MSTRFRIGNWSIIAVLALVVASFSVALADSETSAALFFDQSGTPESDLPEDLEAGVQSAAPQSPSPSEFEDRFAADQRKQEVDSALRPSFKERLAAAMYGKQEPASVPRLSFNERFAAAFDRYPEESEYPSSPAAASVVGQAQPGHQPPPQRSVTPSSKRSTPVPVVPGDTDLTQEPGPRAAIYDISAHAVYLPSGEALEAHSGMDSGLDDPRYVGVKGRGPTPPNVYRLVLREQLFHGVRAIRLVPVDESKMRGRAGMLAHPYMLGPNGQSNGCVSFRDYPAFLNAFLRGEVDSLVVVDRREAEPSSSAGLRWLPDFIRKLFTPS